MGTHWPKPGMNSVSEYQVSGYLLPLSGSANIRYLQQVASGISFLADGNFTVFDATGDDGEGAQAIKSGMFIKGKFLTYECSVAHIVEMTNIPSSSYAAPTLASLVSDS